MRHRPVLGLLLLVFVLPPLQGQVRGSLYIRSTPPGATVYLDGINAGRTPLLLDDLPPGRSRIRLEYRGYERWEEWVLVEAGRRNSVEAELQSAGAMLQVESNAPQPQVRFRDRWIAAEEARPAPGRRALRFRAFGYEDLLLDLEVLPDAPTPVILHFRPAPPSPPRITLSRDNFHPDSPGHYGEIALLLETESPLSLLWEIRGETDATLVLSRRVDLNWWETVLYWDGRRGGKTLPTGAYVMDLRFTDMEGQLLYRQERTVNLDERAVLYPRFPGRSGPGTTLLALPETRTGRTALLDLSAGFRPGDPPTVPVEMGAAWYTLERLTLSAGASVRGDPERETPLFSAGGNALFSPALLSAGDLVQGAVRLGGQAGEETVVEAGLPLRVGRPGGALGVLTEVGGGLQGAYGALGLYRERPRYLVSASARVRWDLEALAATDILIRPTSTPVFLRLTALSRGWTGPEELTVLMGITVLP